MAPSKPVAEHQIIRSREYEEFIEKLRAFHQARGTTFDPEPKMGNMNVDLLQLYKYIIEHGGYDKVSEEKLMWRKMCEGLGLMRHNAPADAYTLKQIFYRNLAAYEIKTEHGKEPPPPEILEHTTAKGGSLLTRTLENFTARVKADKDESGDDGTPSRERRPEETPTTGRASRGLREAPAPRVIFHPETNTPRQTRHASGQHSGVGGGAAGTNTPSQAGGHPSHSQAAQQQGHPSSHHQADRARGSTSYRESHAWPPPSTSHDLNNPTVNQFQVPPLRSMDLRVVDTPSSNPTHFAQKQRLLRQANAQNTPNTAAVIRAALPAATLEGPNIYERCLFSLRSGIRSEQAFGLNHLVKISYERGDKYKFSQFMGLAEGLTEFALEVGSLFYHVNWTICNDPDADEIMDNELDGINGTADILDRIARLKPKSVQDNFQPAEFTDHLTLVTEAVLTIRNMVMLQENAWFMSEYMPLKDLLCILLHLPDMDLTVELKHSALDIAEQITPYLVLPSDDPLYVTLLIQLGSTDRGTILTALRAISRIAMAHPTETNKLSDVPPSVLQNMMNWLLLNDDELMDACLDFLYQYTAIVSNLDVLLRVTNVEHLVAQLVRLLSHGAKRGTREYVVSDSRVRHDNDDRKHSDEVCSIPQDLLDRLLAMDEPDRCYQWVKCFFEEDTETSVTQIAIWQAYNNAFSEPLKKKGKAMMNAAEFIRNISAVYQASNAQIVREGEVQRFIIRCIRPRQYPISPEGRGYFQCLWQAPGAAKCSVWNLSAAKMWQHILEDHLGERADETKSYRNHEGNFVCHWDGCLKYPQPTRLNLFHFMAHIKTHVKTEEIAHSNAQKENAPVEAQTPSSRNKRPKPRVAEPAQTIQLTYEETASIRDERNPNAPPQAAGIPLSAVLILRNIARNVGKTEAEEALLKGHDMDVDDVVGYKERLFRPVMGRLIEVFTENRLLAKDLTQLILIVDAKVERPRNYEN